MDRDLVSDAEYQEYLDYLEEYEAEREEAEVLLRNNGTHVIDKEDPLNKYVFPFVYAALALAAFFCLYL